MGSLETSYLSSSARVQVDGGLFDRIFEIKNLPLFEIEQMILAGTYPEYLVEVEKCQEKFQWELEMLNIMENSEVERIEQAYKSEMESLDKEYEQGLNDLTEMLFSEIDEKKRQLENEIHGLDITASSVAQSNYYYSLPNKKTLRRRTNEQIVENSEKNKGARKPSPQTIVQLLSDAALAEDGSSDGGSLARANSFEYDEKVRRVSLENNRLIYEGKTFHRGQSVTIQSVNYGKFSAILQAVTDKHVQFRSSIAGDTRQVTATKDDLESGRVVVRKRY